MDVKRWDWRDMEIEEDGYEQIWGEMERGDETERCRETAIDDMKWCGGERSGKKYGERKRERQKEVIVRLIN